MKSILMIMVGLLSIAGLAADEWYPVRVEFSDGKAQDGKVAILGTRPLTFNLGGLNYQRKILLDDILSIDQVVESQTMNRPWAYKENGKSEREYFDGQYPFINFLTVITLTSGEILKGHIVSLPMRFDSGKDRSKLFLPRQIKGEVGQTMKQIVYPTRLVFRHAKMSVPDTLVKLAPDWGTVQTVAALDCRRENVCFASAGKDGAWHFPALLPGRYDLVVLTSKYVLFGLSDAGPDSASAGQPLPADALSALQKVFPLTDDFFKDRWLLEVSGNTAFAKTLVYGRRTSYYDAHKITPGGYLWHLEIWSWHRAESEWKIDRRYIMLRRKQQAGEAVRKLYQFDRLAGVKPGAVLEFKAEDVEHGGKFIRTLN